MQKWFNLADIHRDKCMQDTLSSYRGRIARTHAQYVRHIDLPQEGSGRPRRVTLLTQEGVEALYQPGETLPKLKAYPVPMRLTDKARSYIVEPGEFTTAGLEAKPRQLERDEFISFLIGKKNETLIEPDFIPL